MQDSAMIDSDVVAELQDVMGNDFSVLVESFERDGRQRLAALTAALDAGDTERFRREAHSFKGSSGNLGAVQVCTLCMELEALANEGNLSRAVTVLERLDGTFKQACDALNAL
ncbi:Hpt domain-containing protein [Alcanivorax sp. MD8A]|uniref:Hpt domain-containing protein n=1 Tax=Alcanivorax sp. MD8A TaxID=1177157 RepID=UPI0018EDE504|nr:Hpt domain-containing protein [Alcanivorax sp. MD8A]MEE2870844.1 Hpt domain-containing protein [Pseudomonadota bacterium]